MVAFESMVQENIYFEKLQARQDIGVPLSLSQKGVGSCQNGLMRFGRRFSLGSMKRLR
jgi:hypothetical protein